VGAVSCCGTIMDAIQEKRKQEFNRAQGLVANLMKGVPDGGNQTIKT
jgi:hypothetical protein